jgi:hypothetical protein
VKPQCVEIFPFQGSMPNKPVAGVLLTNSQIWREARTVDRDKVKGVGDYLQTEFPGHNADDFHDPERMAQCFRTSAQGSNHHAVVAHEFLDGHEAVAVGPKLVSFTLAEHLRDLPSGPVIFTSHGLKLEY